MKGRTTWIKGKKMPEYVRKKISEANKGRLVSEETREKIRKANKGKRSCRKGKHLSEETKEKIRKAKLEHIKKVNGFVFPAIGRHEKQILDELEIKLGYRIIRQYQVGGYFLDGYIPEINLAIEVDEKYHKNQKEKDIQREEFIKQKLGCQFLRIKDY